MAGNTFRMGETVLIECEIEGTDSSISDVDIEIRCSVPASGITGWTDTYPIAVSGTQMEEDGNQKYRYYWDTRNWVTWSGYSGYSAWSGYSAAVSGLYNVTITARDSKDRYGEEEFKIRIG